MNLPDLRAVLQQRCHGFRGIADDRPTDGLVLVDRPGASVQVGTAIQERASRLGSIVPCRRVQHRAALSHRIEVHMLRRPLSASGESIARDFRVNSRRVRRHSLAQVSSRVGFHGSHSTSTHYGPTRLEGAECRQTKREPRLCWTPEKCPPGAQTLTVRRQIQCPARPGISARLPTAPASS